MTHQASSKHNIPPNERLRLFHLVEQLGITNDPRRVPDFPTRLVQTSDDAYNSTFLNIGDLRDLLERLLGQLTPSASP